jgi:hypothetical protein
MIDVANCTNCENWTKDMVKPMPVFSIQYTYNGKEESFAFNFTDLFLDDKSRA